MEVDGDTVPMFNNFFHPLTPLKYSRYALGKIYRFTVDRNASTHCALQGNTMEPKPVNVLGPMIAERLERSSNTTYASSASGKNGAVRSQRS